MDLRRRRLCVLNVANLFVPREVLFCSCSGCVSGNVRVVFICEYDMSVSFHDVGSWSFLLNI